MTGVIYFRVLLMPIVLSKIIHSLITGLVPGFFNGTP